MKIAIKNGTLIDGMGGAPLPNGVILIEKSKIVDLISMEDSPNIDLKIPQDAQVIDASGKTIMPGLIDAHLHLLGVRSMQPVQWVLDMPALRAVRATKDVQKLIEAGFTSVRCAGSDVSFYLKKAIDEGTIQGPRIVAAHKCISQTAGHGDTHELPLEWVIGPYTMERIADGADDCRRAAREQIREGAGVIKICSTGGVLSEKDAPSQAQFIDEEIAAISTEAHRVGIKVMAHAQKKAKESHKAQIKSIKQAYQAGVRIALGTDFCGPDIIPHGENAVELEIFVNQVGMSPSEAIVAATKVGAEALGLEKEIGTLEKGKKADILIVDGDPLEYITILQKKDKLLVIMKEGKIIVDSR